MIAEGAADRLCLRDVAGDVDILLGAVAVPSDLDGRGLFFGNAPLDNLARTSSTVRQALPPIDA